MVRYMCNFKPEDSVSAEEQVNTLRLNSIVEHLHDKRLHITTVLSFKMNLTEC